MKHNNKLTTLQARTIIAIVTSVSLTSNTIDKLANNIVDNCIVSYPTIYKASDKLVYLAFTLSQLYQKAVSDKVITVIEFIQLLAKHKQTMFNVFNDKGAFCDLYEILTRIAFIKNINLVKPFHLYVKQILQVDLISKKYGLIEIGFNGKTLQEGTLFDYMEGRYNTFVYGVIDNYTRDLIVELCINGDIEKAIKILKAYTIIINKYDFIPTLSSYRKGKIIVVKSGKIMVQYNDSLYNCVLNAIDSGDLITLEMIL